MLQVKVIAIDDQDRVKLSRKALLREQNPRPQGEPPPRRPPDSGPRRPSDRDHGGPRRHGDSDRGHPEGDQR